MYSVRVPLSHAGRMHPTLIPEGRTAKVLLSALNEGKLPSVGRARHSVEYTLPSRTDPSFPNVLVANILLGFRADVPSVFSTSRMLLFAAVSLALYALATA